MCSTREQPQSDQLTRWKANRKLWVEALRGGAYEQTRSVLKDTHGAYCCLGVLTELAGVKWRLCGGGYLPEGHDYETACKQAMDFVGLEDCNGSFYDKNGALQQLARLNDDGASFAEIAEIIESEPTHLFGQGA